MLDQRIGQTVSDDAVDAGVNRMSSLPPHPEVPEALARLREAPLKVARSH